MCQPVFKNFFLLFQTEAVGKMNDARRFPAAPIGARAQKSFAFCPCGFDSFDTLFFTKKKSLFFFSSSFSAVYITRSVAERNVQLVGSSSSSLYVTREKKKKALVINGGIERRRRRRKKEQGKDSSFFIQNKSPARVKEEKRGTSQEGLSRLLYKCPCCIISIHKRFL